MYTAGKTRVMAGKKSPEQLRDSIRNHFDSLADHYDDYKKHSEYYYSQLKALLENLIPDADTKNILEVGCGTGSLLATLAPRKGMGIDISEKMVHIARSRWRDRDELRFDIGEAETLRVTGHWDVVFMCDVLEHLYSPEQALKRFSNIFEPGTQLIITWANALWEPILYTLEKLHLKMPEGDHNWENRKTVLRYLSQNGFDILDEGTRCLIPARVPGADWVNRSFHRHSLLRGLGLIRYIRARRTD